MTTNRMGLEQTLSDERLEQISNEAVSAERIAMARELLAYLKVSNEPVADVVAWNKPGEERKCDIRWRRFDVAPGPLYEAPPLQAVTVPDAIEPDCDVIKGILPTSNPDEYACCIAADMWNACRNAMLKSVTNGP